MYIELLKRVSEYLNKQGFHSVKSPPLSWEAGKPLKQKHIEIAEKNLGLNLPLDLAEFYFTVGDGLSFLWEIDNVEDVEWVGVNIRDLKDSLKNIEEDRKNSIHWSDGYKFGGVDDTNLARQTAIQMRKWLPIKPVGNGDEFCIDLGSPGFPVVFNRHDWFDGGTGANGHIMAANFAELFRQWANVCFQDPRNDWRMAIGNNGVDWKGDNFNQNLRLPP
ncbi:MAG: SMI1/KNR4 family protein [Planctomycetes bacterium]|nr:SMI1/KNR4 family protein [Planctomycetota bacterium]